VARLLALAAPVGGDLVLTVAADTTLRLVGVTDVAALAGSVERI
jgi:hypothetical protein